MDALTELALLFKDRENPSVQDICVGKVLTELPDIKITVNGFILDKSRLVLAKHLINTYATTSTSIETHGEHLHSVEDLLQKGNRVIVIPTRDNSTYFVIDKVGDI